VNNSILRIISLLLFYLTASDYLNIQTAIISFAIALILIFNDLYSYGLQIKISLQTVLALFLLIFLFLVNPYSLYITFLLLFLSLKPISNSKILLNYTFASCFALLIIGIISLTIFDLAYARYFDFVSYDIIAFIGTTPQQFGVLILTCSYLVFKSRYYLIKYTKINPLIFLGIFVFLEYIIAERFLTFLCSLIFLSCLRSYKKLRILFLPFLSSIILAIIFSSSILQKGSLQILNLELILERMERIISLVQLNLEIGPEVYSEFSSRYYGIGDYLAIGSLLSQGPLWAILMTLIIVFYLIFYFKGRFKIDTLGLVLLTLLIIKNSGRFSDPSIIFLLVATLIASFDYVLEGENLKRKKLKA
tara:strand:+ start:16765 stop:17850 length:1086 start_codon:yes stop_codon:yes gene_type:complete